jgi:hypothetical protein
MKISDILVSAILKRGILYDAKVVDMDFEIPTTHLGINEGAKENKIKMHVKCDNMTLRIEKDSQ